MLVAVTYLECLQKCNLAGYMVEQRDCKMHSSSMHLIGTFNKQFKRKKTVSQQR